MSGYDIFAWIVLVILLASAVGVFCIAGWLPGHTAATARSPTVCRSRRLELHRAALSAACGNPRRHLEISGTAGSEPKAMADIARTDRCNHRATARSKLSRNKNVYAKSTRIAVGINRPWSSR
jgi:hypothetical protein